MNKTLLIELAQELRDTWGYDTSELNDIVDKMVTYGSKCYRDGLEQRQEMYQDDDEYYHFQD